MNSIERGLHLWIIKQKWWIKARKQQLNEQYKNTEETKPKPTYRKENEQKCDEERDSLLVSSSLISFEFGLVQFSQLLLCFFHSPFLFCARISAHRNKLHILCAMTAIKKRSCRREWREIAIFIMKIYDDSWLDNTFCWIWYTQFRIWPPVLALHVRTHLITSGYSWKWVSVYGTLDAMKAINLLKITGLIHLFESSVCSASKKKNIYLAKWNKYLLTLPLKPRAN